MDVRFCPLVSGSSGNSTYIGSGNTHILIDAGVSCKQIVEHIGELGVVPGDIDAVFITHEHIDHIKGIGVLARKYRIPLYATPGTWQSIGNNDKKFRTAHITEKAQSDCFSVLLDDQNFGKGEQDCERKAEPENISCLLRPSERDFSCHRS